MKPNLENTWYNVHDENKIITPGLLISPEKIKDNIKAMIQISGTANRLWPHIKTYKMKPVIELQKDYGTDNINIQDGTINYPPEQTTPEENGETDKKD